MASGTDFFPNRDGDLALHLQHLRDALPTDGKTLGWDDAKIKASQGRCDRLLTALAASQKKYTDYLAQAGATRAAKKVEMQALRVDIRELKGNPAFTKEIGLRLGIVASSSTPLVASTDKVVASGEARGTTVRIRWKKGPLDGVNIYMRRQGESDWRPLGRDNRSPYDDTTPMAKPGVPEVREYKVVGVKNDLEVGAPSDIVSVLLAA